MSQVFVIFNMLLVMHFASTTIDMNIHELQFVADHLTLKECEKVEAALNQRSFQLDLKKLDKQYKKSVKLTKKIPCLVRLLNWDRGIGRKNTFHDLAIRLKELGFVTISDKLSNTVYHEKAEAMKTQFLKDPFKKLIPTKSVLLDKPHERRSMKFEPAPIEDGKPLTNTIMWIAIGCISVIVTIFVGFYVCCPKAFRLIWQKVAPEGCVVGCEVMVGETSMCCKKFGKHYNRHLLGKRHFKNKAASLPQKELIDSFDTTLKKAFSKLHSFDQ